jgi:hypothetical protein
MVRTRAVVGLLRFIRESGIMRRMVAKWGPGATTSKLQTAARARAGRTARTVVRKLLPTTTDNTGADRGAQLLLSLAWAHQPDLPFQDVEFRNNSQNGEDGILLYLFTLAGHGSRRAVEMCAGDGIECNTANLVLHHDWDALMLDGSAELLAQGSEFYTAHPETCRVGPTLAAKWITRENVNGILAECGYASDIDLLVTDMDGVDYWILESIVVRPRVIVVEYNNRIPANLAVTVPYSPDFVAERGAWAGDGFFGASLAAFDTLLQRRRYRLVGANRHNTNAFFLREDVLPERRACSVDSCLSSRWAELQQKTWPTLANRPWVTV